MNIFDEIVQKKRPVLILAGPGMGKTYTLAYKMKYLVKDKGINPDEITVITFTNEAAINMRKRISQEGDKNIYIEPELQPSVICTMHKLGHRIIKDYYSKLALKKDFKVLSSGYLRDVIIKDCAQIIGYKRKDAKETIVCRQKGKCIKTGELKCKICCEYELLLRRFNYIDHDDQILLPCKLLREGQGILNKEQNNAKYLLVDEYQDINYAQRELIKLLSKGHTENLFVVGDEYQSIYSFRGGSPEYIKTFKDDYAPNAEVITLTKCRRCPRNIFKGAFYMVNKYNNGINGLEEKFEFINLSNCLIKIHNFEYNNQEADFIARKIKNMGPSYDVLILVPSLNYAKPIKLALRKHFVDFSCYYDIDETDLYLISVLLKWLKDSTDNFNFRILIEEIINRGVSDIPSEHVEIVGKEENKEKRELALREISNFWKEIDKGKTLYKRVKTLKNEDIFKNLVNTIYELRKFYKNKNANNVVDFVSSIINELKIWKNISLFSDEINSVVEEIKNITVSGGEHNVRILTMKKAKGLEADYVFIVGIENNILPRENANELEKQEDSRLLYVSMTRAKKELYLLHSQKRDKNITKISSSSNEKSEFVNAIPTCYKEEINNL
jgi:DNA helicase-2/ATP-dependent DNA helicase PcrA